MTQNRLERSFPYMAFDLSSLHKGKQAKPPRILMFGPDGTWKSTTASHAPSPVFVQIEDGLGNIDTTSFPLATSYQDVLDALDTLINDDHEFKTVVIDSLDWMENLIWKHVAKENNCENIEEMGYGKGYVYAVDCFRDVLGRLNTLRDSKGMIVILTAHCQIKRFDDPSSEPYDRYTLKLHVKTAGIVKEWCDIVGFVNQAMVVKKEDVGFDKKTSRAISTGGNVLHLNRTPAFDAKNRYGLPDTLPMSWSAIAEALAQAHQA